jgi:hypothetical protein
MVLFDFPFLPRQPTGPPPQGWRSKEICSLTLTHQQRFDFPEQLFISSESFVHKGGPLARFTLKRCIKQLLNLPKTFRRHNRSDK